MDTARRIFVSFVLALCILLADQASKWQVLNTLMGAESPVITLLPFFDLVLVWNTGISFGMFAAQHQPLILIGVSVVILLVLLVWLWRTTSLQVTLALGLVIGGAIGNVIDRLRYGAVVDFLDLHIGRYHWPAFNIADSAIFIGVVLLALRGMLKKKGIAS